VTTRHAPVVIFITDPAHTLARTIDAICASAGALGPDRLLVQLRDKTSTNEALLQSARALRAVATEVQSRFVVNGPLEIAKAVGADGLHIAGPLRADPTSGIANARAALGAEAFVTTVAHDDGDVRIASEAGATAVLVSPIFASPGKGVPRGVAALAASRSIVDAMRRVPPLLVYALGGVTPENAASCARAGADGAAAIRAFYEGDAALAATALAAGWPDGSP
jgi:thiamine-phosphate pyrophosphorylase